MPWTYIWIIDTGNITRLCSPKSTALSQVCYTTRPEPHERVYTATCCMLSGVFVIIGGVEWFLICSLGGKWQHWIVYVHEAPVDKTNPRKYIYLFIYTWKASCSFFCSMTAICRSGQKIHNFSSERFIVFCCF